MIASPSRVFWAGKRVLLTGHTGFKGAWCALWLKNLGADVYGLSLQPSNEPSVWNSIGKPGSGDHDIGDVRDPAAVEAAFDSAKPEIVIHMAAQALVHPSYDDPAETFETNVMGLVRILDAARTSKTVRAFVNVTSDKCYENVEQVWAYRETERMGGSDPYSASKGCAELVTASYRSSFFKKEAGPFLGSGRAGNVIGGGDWSSDRLIPDCMRSFNQGHSVLIRNPLATRPWQHVLEPLSGYLVLAEALYTKGAYAAEGWNFGPSDADAWNVGRIVERVVELWGENAHWRHDDAAWAKESMLLRVDATKARLRLNWRPRLNINEALAWTVDWYKAVRNGRSALDISNDQILNYEKLEGNWTE